MPQALRVRGRVVRRGQPDYETTRQGLLWNRLVPERFPDLIVDAMSVEDVASAVKYAGATGMKVSVRSGGHSWCGAPLREGGMLIDVSLLRDISLDQASQTASVGPGLTGGELTRALGGAGMAFPVGHCPTVGLGGYLLSGGLGWNSNVWGYGTYSVRAVDVVTAEGRLVRADQSNNSDLFWAARGAGPGFPGVVTGFQLQAQPLPVSATSTYTYPIAAHREIGEWLETIRDEMAREVELTVLLTASQDGDKTLVLLGTAFCGSMDEAAALLAPLEGCPAIGSALARQTVEPTPFEVLHAIIDSLSPEGHRYAADTVWSNAPASDVLDALSRAPALPSPTSLVVAVMHAPRPELERRVDAAFSMSGAFWVTCYEFWDDEKDDDNHINWVRGVIDTFAPLAVGHYVGEVDLLRTHDAARRSFSEPNWQRLSKVRDVVDPGGVFHSFPGP